MPDELWLSSCVLGGNGVHLGIHHREIQGWNEAQQHHSRIACGQLRRLLNGIQGLVGLGRLVVVV